MNDLDLTIESERDAYEAETARILALSDFLRSEKRIVPSGGELSTKLRVDLESACEEALESIRRIAARS